MGLLERIGEARGPGSGLARQDETRSSIDTWINDFLIPASFQYGGVTYPLGLNQTLAGQRAAEIVQTLPGYMAALRACPPAFAAQMVRALVVSQARFTFRNPPWHRSTPRRTFGTGALLRLEKPWKNATTGELLARMEWHAGLAGNAFVVRRPDRLRVLRPDWTAIIYGSDLEPDNPGHALDGELLGYLYVNGGFGNQWGYDPQFLLPDEVAHWSPIPDPENAGVGMSWLTPAIRDLQGDRAAADFKLAYFAQGAPQPLDARVLTPAGWSTMGAMAPGAEVIGVDGKPHPVLAVHPQGEQDVYRVEFSDGSATECTADHIWRVASIADRKKGTYRTLTLAEIVAGGVVYDSGPAKWSVPLVEPVQFEPVGSLPLDPYLLGCLLGDGSFRGNNKGSGGVTLSAHCDDADEMQAELTPRLPAGVSVSRRDRGSHAEFYFRGSGGPRPNPLTSAIKALGLFDVIGHEKFIPGAYIRADVSDRVALLQGLIDTDGHVDKGQPNSVTFSNTSETLCAQLVDLVGGLGGVASMRRTQRGSNRPQWKVRVKRLPEWINPCRLARKADHYQPVRVAGRWRYIAKIEKVGRKHTQCIRVDSADHLYVTDDYIVTHNTPNLVVKGIPATTREKFDELVAMMEEKHAGAANAFKTLYLTAGADATVIGSNLKEIDFKAITESGETRLSVLSRVPASLLGISEGLSGSSLNAGNFSAARRSFADTWVYPSLQDVCAALAPITDVPSDAELWFDTLDIPLLREDAKDAAEITQIQATTISILVRDGFTAESAKAAVKAGDMSLLVHSGLVSVQLQTPGGPADRPESERQARELVEMVQKVYLGVDVVLSVEEAREILNKAGAGLAVPGPDLSPAPAAPKVLEAPK